MEECRAVNILGNSITTSYGHAELKKPPQSIPHSFPLVMFDLEFTFICSKAPRCRYNGCLRRCKPQYLACPRRILPWLGANIVSLPGTEVLAGQCQSWMEREEIMGTLQIQVVWSRCHAFLSLPFRDKSKQLDSPHHRALFPKLTHFYRVVKETILSEVPHMTSLFINFLKTRKVPKSKPVLG